MRGHHGDPGGRGLPDGLGAAGQGGRQAGADRPVVRTAGGAYGTVMTDWRQAAGRRVREIAVRLTARGKLAQEERSMAIARATGELAGLAEKTAAGAVAVLRNGRRAQRRALTGRMRGRMRRALDELAVTIERTATIIAQARSLAGLRRDLAGDKHGPKSYNSQQRQRLDDRNDMRHP